MGKDKKAQKKEEPERSPPFTRKDFERMLDKAIHPEKRKPDKG